MTNHERLRTAREALGWTQATLAARLGVSQGYVALLERGQRQPSDALRRRLARVLDLPATTLPAVARRSTADADTLAAELADLGYPGFSHLRRGRPRRNPAAVLLDALPLRDWTRAPQKRCRGCCSRFRTSTGTGSFRAPNSAICRIVWGTS